MRAFIILLVSMLVVSSLNAAAFNKDVKFRTTKIHISSDKPLSVGSNTLILEIKKDGKIPKDAKVSVKAFMPAMPGMPAMKSKANAIYLGDGKYQVKVNLAMGGTWQLHIFIMPTKGKKTRVKTSLNI